MLEHTGAERLGTLTDGPTVWKVVVTGLIDRVESQAVQFTPIAIYAEL